MRPLSLVRIENADGRGISTQITDIETGENLSKKLKVSRIEIDATEVIKATLHIALPAIDVRAVAHTKRSATIIFDPDDVESVQRAFESIRELTRERL